MHCIVDMVVQVCFDDYTPQFWRQWKYIRSIKLWGVSFRRQLAYMVVIMPLDFDRGIGIFRGYEYRPGGAIYGSHAILD